MSTAAFWIVVSDRHEARIFSVSRPKQKLSLVKKLECREAQAKPRELATDRPGRVFSSAGRARHTLDPEQDAKEHAIDLFARDLAHELNTEFHLEAFDEWVLIAEPKMLGRIRKALTERVAKVLVKTVDKDLSHLSGPELQAALQSVLDEIFSDPRHYSPKVVA